MNISSGRRLLLFSCLALGILSTATFAEESIRKWRDQSGKFEVEAKLIKHENGKVELLKKDGRAITVPITVLSDADQKYIKELADATPDPFAGGAAPKAGVPDKKKGSSQVSSAGLALLTGSVNPVALPTDGDAIFIDVNEPVTPLPADPASALAHFREFIRPLEKLDAYARVSDPILLDPQGPTFALSVHRNGNAVHPATFGRVYLVNATEKKPAVVIDIEETLLLLDHHVASGRSIAVQGVNSPSDRGGDLILLDNLASGKPDAIARWRLPEWDKPGFKPKVEFARLLDSDRAVVQVNSAVYIWDLESGQSIFKIDRIVAGAKIEVSGGGKYLAIPTNKEGCLLIDTAEGELIGTVPFPSTLTPEVHFSPNGEQLALMAGNQFVVWNLVDANLSAEATIGNPTGVFYGWMGDKYLLSQLGGLIAPELGMTLWRYGLPSNNQAMTMAGGVAAIDKGHQMTTLVCLPVPHGTVERVAKQLAGDNSKLMALRPGSEVALKIEAVAGVNEAEIQAGLQAAVEKAGWKVGDRSKIQVFAKIERGKNETLKFRTLGSSRGGASETVNMKPYTASVEIRSGKDVLWSRKSTNMVPRLLRLENGETLQQAVKRHEKADPAYFERLTIPPKILRPEVGKSVGRSRIDNGKWIDY